MQNRLPPVEAIPVDAKPTYLGQSHYSRFQTNFLQSKQFQLMQNRVLQSRPFLSMPNQLPLFQAIIVDAKPTSSGPSYSSRLKTNFLQSKPFQAMQNQLPPVQAIPVNAKPTSNNTCHVKFTFIDHAQCLTSLPRSLAPLSCFLYFSPSRIWSTNYSVLVITAAN